MRMTRGRARRGLLGVGMVMLASLIIGVASAGATVTQSDINSVTSGSTTFGNPFFYVWDNDLGGYNSGSTNQPMMTISGTSNGTTGDTVYIDCLYNDDGITTNDTSIATAPVNSDGTFSWTGTLPDPDWACRLAALPSSTVPKDASPYQGPSLAAAYQQTSQDSSGNTYDYENNASQLDVWNEVESASSCGFLSYLTGGTPATNYSGYASWYCAAALYGDDGISRSEIQVNGRNGYLSYWAATGGTGNTSNALYSGSEGASARADLSLSRSQNASNGNETVSEGENIVECQASPDPYPANSGNCGGTMASGLRLQRTVTTSADGQQVTVSDKYSSVDGAQHSLDVEYENNTLEYDQYYTEWQFPTDGGLHYESIGSSPSLGSNSTGTIYVEGGYNGYFGPYYDVPAAITFTTQPTWARFSTQPVINSYSGSYCDDDSSYPACDLLLDYQRTVPAGGSVTITHVYTTAQGMAEVQALAAMSEDAAVTPSVAITSPSNGATVSTAQVTVVGTAGDLHRLRSLKIDGVPVTADAAGNWSVPVTLSPGSNTITAVVTNLAGNTSQAQETIVYAQALPKCNIPNVVLLSLHHATLVLRANNCQVGTVTTKRTRLIPAGRVYAQSKAGSGHPYGTKVNLTIAQPPKRHTTRHTKKHTASHTPRS